MKLSDRIDKIYMLREQKRGLEAQIKEVNARIEAENNELMRTLDDVGTPTARGELASATITETLVPKIEDWGQVEDYVLEHDAVYLLHRRVSAGPWKELLDTGEQVPGIVPFTKRAISLRKRGD